MTKTADVLLVGPGREADLLVLQNDGVTALTIATCVDALARISRAQSRVIVLPAAEVAGRESAAIRALKASGADVLLTLPPHREESNREVAALGADDALREPYLPAALRDRVRRLLRRRANIASGAASARLTPIIGSEALTEFISDLESLNRDVPHLPRLLDTLLGIFLRRSRARRGSILLLSRKKRTLVLTRIKGGPRLSRLSRRERRIRVGEGISGQVAETRKPLLIADIRRPRFEDLASGSDYETPSCLCLPLCMGDRLLGVLNLADREDGDVFTETDLFFLTALADQAAPILENALRLRRMTALSNIDGLTGLYNQRYFRVRLEQEFKRAQRYEHPLALGILDVDHFKKYNDTNGHEAGNRALKKIAEILKASFRTTDVVARYGGEEFAVIFPETEKGASSVPEQEGGAFRALDLVRQTIERTVFENEKALPGGKLTISGGVASYPADGDAPTDLIEAADRSLYLAKEDGRNRIR